MYGTMGRMVKTTVYLTPELKARLERLASQRRQSEADLIRTALEEFTAGERPRPSFPLVPAGGPTTNDAEHVDEILRTELVAELERERRGE
jgi:Arc/MetJ-type ribon-helix-helix transcriptional regulator